MQARDHRLPFVSLDAITAGPVRVRESVEVPLQMLDGGERCSEMTTIAQALEPSTHPPLCVVEVVGLVRWIAQAPEEAPEELAELVRPCPGAQRGPVQSGLRRGGRVRIAAQ